MKTLNLDLTGVEETNVLPEGVYPCIVEKVELKDSSTPGNAPYLAFTFAVIAEGLANRKLFSNFSLEEKALWRVKSLLRSLGLPTEALGLSVDDSGLVISPPFVGRGCLITAGQETYKGRLQNRVDDVQALEQVPPPVTPGQIVLPGMAQTTTTGPTPVAPPKLNLK